MKLLNAIILAVSISTLSACGKTIEYKPIELSRPARPALPNLNMQKTQSIDDETWSVIVHRNLLMRQYAEQLELIIDATKNTKEN